MFEDDTLLCLSDLPLDPGFEVGEGRRGIVSIDTRPRRDRYPGFRLAAAALTFAGEGGVGEGGAMTGTSLSLLVAMGISAACVGG